MPSIFKQKNQKKIRTHRQINHTLDTKHREILFYFEKEEERIPILEKEILLLKKQLEPKVQKREEKEKNDHEEDDNDDNEEEEDDNEEIEHEVAEESDEDEFEESKEEEDESKEGGGEEEQEGDNEEEEQAGHNLHLYHIEMKITNLEKEIELIKERKKDYLMNNATYIFDYFENKKYISSSSAEGAGARQTNISSSSSSFVKSTQHDEKENEKEKESESKNDNEKSQHPNNNNSSSTNIENVLSKRFLIQKFFKIKQDPSPSGNQTPTTPIRSNDEHNQEIMRDKQKKEEEYSSFKRKFEESTGGPSPQWKLQKSVQRYFQNVEQMYATALSSSSSSSTSFVNVSSTLSSSFSASSLIDKRREKEKKSSLLFNTHDEEENTTDDLTDDTNLSSFFHPSSSFVSSSVSSSVVSSSFSPTSSFLSSSNINTLCQNVGNGFDSYYYEICKICFEGEMVSYEDEGMMICNNANCGNAIEYLVETEKPTYKEPPKEVCFYAYQRFNHWKEVLAQIQGKETTQIHPNVFKNISKQITKERIKLKDLTYDQLKSILKKLGYSKLYEHISYIGEKFGIQPPIMSPGFEELLKYLFIELQRPYSEVCPDDRFNFLNYYYTGHKLCELIGAREWLKYFPLLKDREKIIEQDCIWKKLCAKKKWRYIPTI